MSFDPARAATALLASRRARQVLRELPAGAWPRTLDEGVAAQTALARSLGAVPPAGFKIGATTRGMQEYLGLDGPAAGFMPADGLHGSGSALSFAAYLNPGVECELAVHLGRDLPPGPCTSEQAASAVDGVMAAIEIVEKRYWDLRELGTPALVADQVFHAGAVLGEPAADWAALDLAALPGRMSVDGAIVGEGMGADLLGHPMRALAWLASSSVAAAFGGLRAGQVVMLGSVTPPIWLERPGVVEVRFPPLGVVSLTFT